MANESYSSETGMIHSQNVHDVPKGKKSSLSFTSPNAFSNLDFYSFIILILIRNSILTSP